MPEKVYIVIVDGQIEALYYNEANAREDIEERIEEGYAPEDVAIRTCYINDFNERYINDPLYNQKMSIALELNRLEKEVSGYAPDDDYLDIMNDLEISIDNLYKKVNMIETIYALLVYSNDFDSPLIGVYESLDKAEEKRREYIDNNIISEDMIFVEVQHIIK